MADVYESVLCVKNEVFVYRIPPRPSNRGYRASEWSLDTPDWTGRLRVVARGKDLFIKLEDKTSGELFAQCPVEAYPSIAVEPVMDSSRYFVIRIKDPSGKSAFIGIGFSDRSDSFDLNVSLQDHFKWLKQEDEASKAAEDLEKGPKLDLGFKEGQTITLNIGSKKGDVSKPKPKRAVGGLLPPPPGPGSVRFPTPPTNQNFPSAPSAVKPAPNAVQTSRSISPANVSNSGTSNVDLLLDLGPSDTSSASPLAPLQSQTQNLPDLWGDFTGASSSRSITNLK
ncbi:hypothetical protein C0Q70_03869 [Pomacea canaliculata]|uniref:NECAP PHear domain-containing protein n=1 Tax=Pomacea canaliculata TaxID=400727 RepID=A0A2T7PTZ0_POMCA|nr:hypothetical protein C0Q70_03869 [Pomacea canaliculata]